MSKTITGLAAVGLMLSNAVLADEAADKRAILETYADIAHAAYGDSLLTARALDQAIQVLVSDPSEETLQAAREAWRVSRVPYQQTEVYRFGNPIVDEWEGKLTSSPA